MLVKILDGVIGIIGKQFRIAEHFTRFGLHAFPILGKAAIGSHQIRLEIGFAAKKPLNIIGPTFASSMSA
jgi:hypothetical protein